MPLRLDFLGLADYWWRFVKDLSLAAGHFVEESDENWVDREMWEDFSKAKAASN